MCYRQLDIIPNNARSAWQKFNYFKSSKLYGQVNTIYPIFEESIIGNIGSLLMVGNKVSARKILHSVEIPRV